MHLESIKTPNSNAFEKILTVGSIKIPAVVNALEELEIACQKKIDATESFAGVCKAVAGRAGMEPAVLSAYVTARVKNTIEKQQKKVEQLSLLFNEIGS